MVNTLFRVLFLGLLLVAGEPAQAFYDPTVGRWLSRDPLGDEAFLQQKGESFSEQVNSDSESFKHPYRYVDNDSVNKIDPFGLSIWTGESSSDFREAILAALEKVSGGDLCWAKEKEQWKIVVIKKGSGKLWGDLNTGIKASTRFNIFRYSGHDNAWAYTDWWRILGRDVYINENFSPMAPLQRGGVGQTPMSVVLWHELVGHAILKRGHPREKWNTWEFRLSKPLPARWGKVDPTIAIENEARQILGLPPRRSQYWETKAAWKN